MLTVKIIEEMRKKCKENHIYEVTPGEGMRLHDVFINIMKTEQIFYKLNNKELDTYFLFFISEYKYTTRKYNLTYTTNPNNSYDIICTNGCYTGDNIISIIFYIYNAKIITGEEYIEILDLFILKFSCDINYLDNYHCTSIIHCMRNQYIIGGKQYDPTDVRVFLLLNYLKYNPDIFICDNINKSVIDYALELDRTYNTDNLYTDIINEYEKMIKNPIDD
jgi:hypothetical protein